MSGGPPTRRAWRLGVDKQTLARLYPEISAEELRKRMLKGLKTERDRAIGRGQESGSPRRPETACCVPSCPSYVKGEWTSTHQTWSTRGLEAPRAG
jgi:hypothetical protein